MTHTPTKGNWESRFDKEFGNIYVSDNGGGHFVAPYSKTFIRSLLLAHDKELIKKLENMKEEKFSNYTRDPSYRYTEENILYTQALSAAIAIIKEET